MTKHKTTSAEHIRELMNANNVSQSDLARELGMTRGAVSQKFKAKRFTLRDISRIADYFDVSTDWLLGRTEQQKLPEKATK